MEAKYVSTNHRIIDNIKNFTHEAKEKFMELGINSWIYDVPKKRLSIVSDSKDALDLAEDYVRKINSIQENASKY